MDIFRWDESMDSGFPEIDEQHRRLFAMANGLHEAILGGRAAQVLESLAVEVFQDSSRHFRAEEALMREAGYPALANHLADHSRFEQLLSQLSAGAGELTPFQVVQVFNVLIRGHIVEVDLPMIRWVRTHHGEAHLGRVAPTRLNPNC